MVNVTIYSMHTDPMGRLGRIAEDPPGDSEKPRPVSSEKILEKAPVEEDRDVTWPGCFWTLN